MNISLNFLHPLPPFPLESEGGWENDTFGLTIFCRELVSSWQTFSVVVDCYENPVHPLFNESTGARLDDGGLPCEIPDNGYPESWDNSWDSSTSDYVPDYQMYSNFDESNNTFFDANTFPDGVGEIFLTDNTNLNDTSKPGVNIDKDEEIYFRLPIDNSVDDSGAVKFIDDQGNLSALITKEGHFFLKGKLISDNPVLENDKEELPPETPAILYSYPYTDPPENNPWSIDRLVEEIPPFSLTPDSGKKEWVLKNGVGEVVALLDYSSGNLKIAGELLPFNVYAKPDQHETFLNKKKFVVRSGVDNDTIVFVIDEDGNLYTKGVIIQKFLFF